MISVDAEHRKYQKFLWWESRNCEKMKVFQYKRVVFGMSSSPFILAAVLEHHLNCPEGDVQYAGQLRRSLYVDNCATSLDSVEEYEDFKSTSVKLLEYARMELQSLETNLDRDGESSASVL